MYVRRVRRKCNVRGCRCIDSYAISWTKEAGNTVIVCKKCLKEALAEIEKLPEGARSNLVKAEAVPAVTETAPADKEAEVITEKKAEKQGAAKKTTKKK